MTSLPRDREYRSYQDECINRNAGYRPTWSLDGSHTHHTTTNTADGSTVTLGHKATADDQRAADGESLAALACGYGPSRPAPVAETTGVDEDVLAVVAQIAVDKHPAYDTFICRAFEALVAGHVRMMKVNGGIDITLGHGVYRLRKISGQGIQCSCPSFQTNLAKHWRFCKHYAAYALVARVHRLAERQ